MQRAYDTDAVGGTTLLMVSHSIEDIRRMCTHAAWIDHGELRQSGEVMEVTEAYVKGFKWMQIQRMELPQGGESAREKTVYQMFKGAYQIADQSIQIGGEYSDPV